MRRGEGRVDTEAATIDRAGLSAGMDGVEAAGGRGRSTGGTADGCAESRMTPRYVSNWKKGEWRRKVKMV